MTTITDTDEKSPWGKYDVVLGGLLLLNILVMIPFTIGAVFGWAFTALAYAMYIFMFFFFCLLNPCM